MAKEIRKNSQEERRSSRSRSQDRNREQLGENTNVSMQGSRAGEPEQAERGEGESWDRSIGGEWKERSRGETSAGDWNEQRAGRGDRAEAGGASGSQRADHGQSSGVQRHGGGRGAGLQRHGMQSPFAFMRRFSEDMDRLLDEFWGGGSGLAERDFGSQNLMRGFGEGFWAPQLEVLERDGELHVRADLPGINKDQIEIECDDDSITIRGERRQEHEENQEGFYQSERSYGSFMRTIPLPRGVDTSKARARFENGVLDISMPAPQEQRRGRRIEIGTGAGTPEGTRSAKGAGRETREGERDERERRPA